MVAMQDVARVANVSLSTVSYALSGVRPVSAATKARIAAAMEELKFQPNAMARGLASRRSRVIALLHPLAQSVYERTSADFIHSASLAARERGYEFVIWPFGPEQATEARNLALQGSADGVLLMEIDTDDARVEALRDTGIPFTMIGRTDDCEGLPYVDIDFEQTMEAAVEHLTTLGHRNIGFLGRQAPRATGGYGPNVRSARSFVEAMDRRNLPRQVLYGDLNPEAGRMAVAEFFFRDPGSRRSSRSTRRPSSASSSSCTIGASRCLRSSRFSERSCRRVWAR